MSKRKLKMEELACLVGVSVQTINIWYKWKRHFPDNELAKLLPDYTQEGPRHTRYWDEDAVWRIIEFKQNIIRGRNGVMGDITQRRLKTGKKKGG